MLDFYARRSPIFLAARFDADAARTKGVALGDGTPVHITIPTTNPWVPLRILGVGRQATERIDADVFLLTPQRPTLLPGNDAPGLRLGRQEPATDSLLRDLRSDKGMGWLPSSMWLSYLEVDALPSQLTYDLAVDATSAGAPSKRAAGLEPVDAGAVTSDGGAAARSCPPPWPAAPHGRRDRHRRRARRQPPPQPQPRHGTGVTLRRTGPAFALGIVTVTAVAGVVLAGAVLAASGGPSGDGMRTVTVTIHHSKFSVDDLRVTLGETVRFVVRNTDPIPHELIIGDQGVQDVHEAGTEAHHAERPGEVSGGPGGTATTTFRFGPDAGRLLFGCHLPGHWAYGMRGTFSVSY